MSIIRKYSFFLNFMHPILLLTREISSFMVKNAL
jgi:hypothetical protein